MPRVLTAADRVGRVLTLAGGSYVAVASAKAGSGECKLQVSPDGGATWIDTEHSFNDLGELVADTSIEYRYRWAADVAGWVIDMASERDEGPARGRL